MTILGLAVQLPQISFFLKPLGSYNKRQRSHQLLVHLVALLSALPYVNCPRCRALEDRDLLPNGA